MGFSVHLNFVSRSLYVHRKTCPQIQVKQDKIRYDVWSKDFVTVEEAQKEMLAAADFCEIHIFGPCELCDPFNPQL
jgi:hypothetical protein